MKKNFSIALAFLVVLVGINAGLANKASALSCFPQTLQESVDVADAVVLVEIISVQQFNKSKAEAKVLRSWKGPREGSVIALHGAEDRNWGTIFQDNRQYVIFGEGPNPYKMGMCSGRAQLLHTQADIDSAENQAQIDSYTYLIEQQNIFINGSGPETLNGLDYGENPFIEPSPLNTSEGNDIVWAIFFVGTLAIMALKRKQQKLS